jgi:predicted sugar kinase
MIEIGAPANLLLGLVTVEQHSIMTPCLMGVTLQHPPVHLSNRPGRGLRVTGARANLAHQQAERFLQAHGLEPQSDLRIELAIPLGMGLSSEPMLGLSVARTLAWQYDLPRADIPALARATGLAPTDAPAIWGFDQGGLLFVDAAEPAAMALPPILRRYDIAHPDKHAWVFVLILPRLPAGTPATLEAERLTALRNAVPHLGNTTWPLVRDRLWPALEQDDLPAFAQALMQVAEQNQAALAAAGTPHTLTAAEQAILDLLRTHGAVAWGRSLTGLALYGLIEGAQASRELRRQLRRHLGPFGGTVMATITDNGGAREVIKGQASQG